jgi:hypothetical protein
MSVREKAATTFDKHRREQIVRIARTTTPAQRLAWLEEMIRLALRTGALPKRRSP